MIGTVRRLLKSVRICAERHLMLSIALRGVMDENYEYVIRHTFSQLLKMNCQLCKGCWLTSPSESELRKLLSKPMMIWNGWFMNALLPCLRTIPCFRPCWIMSPTTSSLKICKAALSGTADPKLRFLGGASQPRR